MPTISTFYGIVIRMYFDDHGPPHFHAYSGGSESIVSIETLEFLRGSLPRRASALVLEWAFARRPDLRANWLRAASHEPLLPIAPLEWSAMIRVARAIALPPHRLELEFTDGLLGEVDLSGRLFGPMFEPLLDPALFARVAVDEFGAVCWPNGADLAPDGLHEQIRRAASCRSEPVGNG